MKAEQTSRRPKSRYVVLSVGIIIILLVGIVLYDSSYFEYTITVEGQEWRVKNSIAQRVLRNGSTHPSEGISAVHTYFPRPSINRTIEIDLEITDGTIDLLVFGSLNDYHSWLYGYITEVALYHWENITSIETTFMLDNPTVFDNSSVYIAQRAHQGGASVIGPILASCFLS